MMMVNSVNCSLDAARSVDFALQDLVMQAVRAEGTAEIRSNAKKNCLDKSAVVWTTSNPPLRRRNISC